MPRSQINTINNYLKKENLNNTLILIPDNDFKNEIDHALRNIQIKYKKKSYYMIHLQQKSQDKYRNLQTMIGGNRTSMMR